MQPTGEWNCRIEHGIASLKGQGGRRTLSTAAARWNIHGTCQHSVFHAVVGFDGSICNFYFLFRFPRCPLFFFHFSLRESLLTYWPCPSGMQYFFVSRRFSVWEGGVVIFGFAGLCSKSLLVRVVYSALIRPDKHPPIFFLSARLLDFLLVLLFGFWRVWVCRAIPASATHSHWISQSAFRQLDDG